MKKILFISFLCLMFASLIIAWNQQDTASGVNITPVDEGWAKSSVNAVIFRKNSITSHNNVQYLSYYDEEGSVMIARRDYGSNNWDIQSTPFTGDVTNAHNSISIGIDGNGVVHMVWGLHNAPMQYVQGRPGDELTFTDEMPMTGQNEESVTYPQFFRIANGDLLFMYRDGASGRGNIMLNRYKLETERWQPVQHPLIDGGGKLSPYVNPIAIDEEGNLHLSWNWRESPDVASNHDIAYAYSPDEGENWFTSSEEPYELPINAENAEIIKEIPQNSELINQTSMYVTPEGNPVIATYWRPEGAKIPQYHIIFYNGNNQKWETRQVGERNTEFSLSGFGTKRIPVARPLVLAGDQNELYMIFRDFERGGGVSAAMSHPPNYSDWQIVELDTTSVGLWEPTYDPALWKQKGELHLFHQYVGQGDEETLEDLPAQKVSVLEWIP